MLAAYQSDQLLRLFSAWRTAASTEDQVSCTFINEISLMYLNPRPSRCYCLQIRRATHTLEQQRIRMAVRAWRVNSHRQQVTFLKILCDVECSVASQFLCWCLIQVIRQIGRQISLSHGRIYLSNVGHISLDLALAAISLSGADGNA